MGGANSLGQHECAVETCHIEVSASRLMCVYHWFKVEPQLRREVVGAWNEWRRYHTDSSFQRYDQVRDMAIAAVEEACRRILP